MSRATGLKSIRKNDIEQWKKSALVLLFFGIMIAPNFTYNIWPQMVPFGWSSKQFMTGNFDLSRHVVPSVYYEVRGWLDANVQPGDVFRVFWLPIDPTILSNLISFYPDTPVFFPRFDERNYTQVIFTYLLQAPSSGWNNGLGKLLANANVKYVVVNLSANEGGGIWKQEGPIALSPWGPAWDLNYYFTGDPKNYAKALDREQGLRLVAQEKHFLVYENLDFVAYVSTYRRALLVAPKNILDQKTPVFSVYNYSNNLVVNGGFEKGLAPWTLAGNWQVSTNAHSGNASLEGRTLEKGWIAASQDIPLKGNDGYYLSGWMRIENVKQSHVKLLFYNESGNLLLTTYPQPGTDGTKDWWYFSESGASPRGTATVTVLLMGGWSLDNTNNATTWFDDISLVEGYYPVPSPLRDSSYDILLASSMNNLISDVPGFDDGSNLIVSGDVLARNAITDERMKQFAAISSGLVFLGDAIRSQLDTEWVLQHPQLLFVYEAESVLQPQRGIWQHLEGPSFGNNQAVEVVGSGQGVQNFYVPRNSYYTITVRGTGEQNVSVKIDDENLTIVPFVDPSGRPSNWYETEGLFLTLGEHKLTLTTSGNSTAFDKIMMISSIGGPVRLADIAGGKATSLSFARLGGIQYNVRIESNGPSFIILGESFDPDWNAYANGVKLSHYALPFHMYWPNVFYLKMGGSNIVQIAFEKQGLRNETVAVWAVGWASSLAYIGYSSKGTLVRIISKPKKKTEKPRATV